MLVALLRLDFRRRSGCVVVGGAGSGGCRGVVGDVAVGESSSCELEGPVVGLVEGNAGPGLRRWLWYVVFSVCLLSSVTL